MTASRLLEPPYHQQDTDYYCGPASAQVVLAQCGAALLDQGVLYADCRNHSTIETSGWFTAPDGLTWTLNNRQSGRVFTLNALPDQDAISRKIVWAIEHKNICPIPLLQGRHWAVIRGYTASAAPSSSDDASYTIQSFDLSDPFPTVPSYRDSSQAPPPPHATGDGCGSALGGSVHHNISYATWCSSYLQAVSDGYWSGKYIAVCDPDPPPLAAGRSMALARPSLGRLEPEAAKTAALRALSEMGLSSRPAWREALAGAAANDPVLVQRIDRVDSSYYLIPFGPEPGKMLVCVSIDAEAGHYREALLFSGVVPAIRAIDTEAIVKQVTDSRVDLGGSRGYTTIRSGAVSIHPAWVWKPCQESLSPFRPFQQINLGHTRLHRTAEGRIHRVLHVRSRGL